MYTASCTDAISKVVLKKLGLKVEFHLIFTMWQGSLKHSWRMINSVLVIFEIS